jgi:N,N-dimethylformamidase beta subunit-like, C-terminal
VDETPSSFTRRRALAAAGVLFGGLGAGTARAGNGPVVTHVEVTSATPFAGDHRMLATVSPSGATSQASVTLRLVLAKASRVVVDVVDRNAPGVHATASEGATAAGQPSLARIFNRAVGRGAHEIVWAPSAATMPGTYSLVVTVIDRHGNRAVLGAASPAHPALPAAPIVRVLGVDATFEDRAYASGDTANLFVAALARSLTVQMLQIGPEDSVIYSNEAVNGVPVGQPVTVDWHLNTASSAAIPLTIGNWPSGVYFARITSDDGRVGYAPFVLRPAAPTSRVAVVMPTNTWQAYNFHDGDGDGFGDSWYVSVATKSIELQRPHLHRGIPFRFRSYDLSFLRWIAHTNKHVDYYSDDDIGAFATGDDLRARYDVLIFPGHHEYVTPHMFTVVQRFRDLGGSLAFLSSNNFFRRVDRHGTSLKLIGLWRDLGRPEAALLGTQYRASDRGTHQHPFVVTQAGIDAGWVFAGTSLAPGSTFGLYGIEVDSTSSTSPPGTTVLAEIPDALGPGLTAQMTYYETAAGSRVFSAGVLNFGGQALLWPETTRLLENVWQRLVVRSS